jgi:hypothetical protein
MWLPDCIKTRAVSCAIVLLFGASGALLPAPKLKAQASQDLREFSPELIPGPGELLERLQKIGIASRADASNQWLAELAQKGEEILSGMSPEQQQGLRQLAERYLQDRGVTTGGNNNRSLADLARKLQEQSKSNPDSVQRVIEDLQRQFQEIEQPNRSSGTGRDEVDSGPPQSARQRGGIPVLPEPLRVEQPRSSGSPDAAGNDRPPRGDRSGIRPPFPYPPQDQAAPGNLPGTATRKPVERQSGENRASADPAPALNSVVAAPQERLGVRFDRMLMEAAQRGIESADPDTQSQVAGSVNSILDVLARNIDSVVRNHNVGTGRGSRPGSGRSSPFNRLWNRNTNPLASPASLAWPDVTAWWPVPVLAGIACLVWFLLRRLGWIAADDPELQLGRPVRFRYKPLTSPDHLVRSVDRFLLAHFGRTADWWDVRRAQDQLSGQGIRHVSDIRLEELVIAYEQARYSPAAGHPDARQLESAGEILRDLALDLSGEHRQAATQPVT